MPARCMFWHASICYCHGCVMPDFFQSAWCSVKGPDTARAARHGSQSLNPPLAKAEPLRHAMPQPGQGSEAHMKCMGRGLGLADRTDGHTGYRNLPSGHPLQHPAPCALQCSSPQWNLEQLIQGPSQCHVSKKASFPCHATAMQTWHTCRLFKLTWQALFLGLTRPNSCKTAAWFSVPQSTCARHFKSQPCPYLLPGGDPCTG